MIIQILSPLLIALGGYLYVLLDHRNGSDAAIRWPGVSLIVIGLLLIPVYHLAAFRDGKPRVRRPASPLFTIALGMIGLAIFCSFGLFAGTGLAGLIWIYPAGILAGAGILMLVASLYTGKKSR